MISVGLTRQIIISNHKLQCHTYTHTHTHTNCSVINLISIEDTESTTWSCDINMQSWLERGLFRIVAVGLQVEIFIARIESLNKCRLSFDPSRENTIQNTTKTLIEYKWDKGRSGWFIVNLTAGYHSRYTSRRLKLYTVVPFLRHHPDERLSHPKTTST